MSGMEKMEKEQLLTVFCNARITKQEMEFVDGRVHNEQNQALSCNIQLLVEPIATRYCKHPGLNWDQKVIKHIHEG